VDYTERQPVPRLAPYILSLWHASAPDTTHARERILPSGCVEVILSLARDFLMDCPEGAPDRRNAPALVVGARSVYEIVDTADMASLIGIHFRPGGFAAFVSERADDFSNRSVPLEGLWGSATERLRCALREIPNAARRLDFLEGFLLDRVKANRTPHPVVGFALDRFAHGSIPSVRDVARSTGWSERRFSKVFREHVGFSPKAWCRIQRFQRAVKLLHTGVEFPLAELALDCGFYDQAHFANEFRAFSGIDATTYSGLRTQFTNHIYEK
jgi:AraC-like DNA-binding protein